MKESKKYATNIIYYSAANMCYIRGSEKIIGKRSVKNEKMEI
jgi:hypothetical protein